MDGPQPHAADLDPGWLPVDPDLGSEAGGSAQTGEADPFGPRVRRRVRPAPGVLAAIFAGGVVGGGARYAIALALPAAHGFPFATFLINVSGAFGLGLLLVVVLELLPPTRYLRPTVGTGFFGAYTTWSTFMVEANRLVAAGHAGLAAAYLGGSLLAGLAAASFGVTFGRALVVRREQLVERERAGRRRPAGHRADHHGGPHGGHDDGHDEGQHDGRGR